MTEDNQLSGFAKLADNLKEQNETAKTIDENRIFAEKIQSQLLDDSIKLSQDQRKELIQLQEILTGNELKTLEDKKEAKAIAEQTLEALEGILENTEDLGTISGPEEGGLLALLAIPVALIALGSGFVVGIAESFTTLIKILGKGLLKAVTPIVKGVLLLWKTLFVGVFKLLNKIPFVKSLTSSIRGFFSNLGGRFTKAGKAIGQAFKPLTNGIKNIKSAFAAGFSGLKSFRTASGQFAKLGKIGNIGKGIAQGLKNISNAAATIKNTLLAPFQQIGKDLAPIKKLMPSGKPLIPKSGIKGIGRVITIMKSVSKAAFTFGRVLGRLFVPITIIMSLFDTFKGALAGFDKYKDKGFLEGIIGGLFGAISGFLTGFIGMPLDLLKDAISWIAEKLGFENFSEQLDSFSFSEMIGKLFTSITDTVIEFIGSIKESIADIGIGNTIRNVGLSILKLFKKVSLFPLAVATGGAAALAAGLKSAFGFGMGPKQAFMEAFNNVMTAGDATIDSFKVQGDGLNEKGESVKAVSEEIELEKSKQAGRAAAANNIISSPTDNSKKSSTVIIQKAATPDRTAEGVSTR